VRDYPDDPGGRALIGFLVLTSPVWGPFWLVGTAAVWVWRWMKGQGR
jgi:hypothetical protein